MKNLIVHKVDVTDFDIVKETIKNAEVKYGKNGCLVNNAGAMLLGSIDTQNISEWQRMYDLNVIAALNGMQAVLSDMKERKTGTIINMTVQEKVLINELSSFKFIFTSLLANYLKVNSDTSARTIIN
jgi:NADP-dependent 3-hydroxy acid dehydrogenase YdfG